MHPYKVTAEKILGLPGTTIIMHARAPSEPLYTEDSVPWEYVTIRENQRIPLLKNLILYSSTTCEI